MIFVVLVFSCCMLFSVRISYFTPHILKTGITMHLCKFTNCIFSKPLSCGDAISRYWILLWQRCKLIFFYCILILITVYSSRKQDCLKREGRQGNYCYYSEVTLLLWIMGHYLLYWDQENLCTNLTDRLHCFHSLILNENCCVLVRLAFA